MDRRGFLVLFLLPSAFLALLPRFGLPAYANPGITRVPEDYPTIQTAIDAAAAGDTVLVSAGTYTEHVVIRKTLTLTGAGKGISVIDGNNIGTTLWIEANNVLVSGFTIQNGSSEGVFLNYTTGTRVVDNVITSNSFYGLSLEDSDDNTIMNNYLSYNQWALGLFRSSGNVVRYNVLTLNVHAGIDLTTTSDNNIFEGNTVSNNGDGISLYLSNGNAVYRNNFVNNTLQAVVEGFSNVWDNGAEGNFWSNYRGSDADGDGIGETPYAIDAGVSDVCPLIEPWYLSRTFPVGTSQGINYYIGIIANSTVASFTYNQSLKQVSFNVTGPLNTSSFCNVTIPKPILIGDPWTIFLGATNISAEVIVGQNFTHTFLSFTHTHSARTVRIIGTQVQVTQLEIHNVAVINVDFSPKEVTAGGNVSIVTTLRNLGNFTENLNVTAFYVDRTFARAIATQVVSSFLAEESRNLSFTWNTSGVVPGQYFIGTQASAVVDETDMLDNTRTTDDKVTIMRPPVHNVAVISVTPTPTQATIGQSIQIGVEVKNEGDFPESFSVEVYYNDTAVGSAQEITSLASNSTRELVFTWITESDVEGTYVISAKASLVPEEIGETDNSLTSAENVTLRKPQPVFQPIYFLVLIVVALIVIVAVYLYLQRKRAGKS